MILFRTKQISCQSVSQACMNKHFCLEIYLADTPHRRNTSCFRGWLCTICSYLDVFPRPQSNTTETFTPSEIAFLYVFRSLWSNLKTPQSAGSRKVLQTSRLAGSRQISHKHWLYSQLFLRNSPRCLRANQGFLQICPM